MNDNDEIQKLLSLEIEKKINERSFSGEVVSLDEFISFVSARSGIAKEKIEEVMRLLSEEMAILYNTDREKFKDILKRFSGTENVYILEDDT